MEGSRVGTRLARQRPSLSEIRRFAGPVFRSGGDKWARVRSVEDFHRLARRRTPRPVLDYVDGAAEDEIAVTRSVAAFKRVSFHPHVLRDVSQVSTQAPILGQPASMPLVLGPTGFTRMMHAAGEVAVARAAARAGVPYVLSTLGTTSVEDLAHAAPDGQRWFQLYVSRDRGRSSELVARAGRAGYGALVLTVDVPVAGARLRDVRNGLTVPPTLTFRTLARIASKPAWLFDALTTPPLTFESLGQADQVATLLDTVFDPGVTLNDLEWLRGIWMGPIVVKGIQRVDDARSVVAAGADAIALSNHGGRQLDRAVAPLELLAAARDALGDGTQIFLDGGVRSGADVAAAVALGASAVFIGRPYLYALMAGGEAGVDHLLQLFGRDFARTLRLLGVASPQALRRDLVSVAAQEMLP